MAIVSLEDRGTLITDATLPQAIAAGEMVYVKGMGDIECQLNSGTNSTVMFDNVEGFLPVGVTSIVSQSDSTEMYLI